MPEFYVTFARKINKIPEFYTTFALKWPNFTLCLPKKYFSKIFFGPVSYAYGWAPGLLPAKSGPVPNVANRSI